MRTYQHIFSRGTCFLQRLLVHWGDQEALSRLEDLLHHPHADMETAALHDELWKMTHNDDHRRTALSLYETLDIHMPNIDYTTRIEEMLQQKKNSPRIDRSVLHLSKE